MAKQGWRPGVWSAICDRCGFEYNSDQIQTEWTGLKVCSKCWEPRHPQDLIRVQPEKIVPPWTRPEQEDGFVQVCDQCTSSAYTGLAAAGCSIVGNEPAYELLDTYAACTPDGWEWPPSAPIVVARGEDALDFRGDPWNVTIPSGDVGDLILVFLTDGDSGVTPSAVGYTSIGNAYAGGTNLRLTVLARTSTGADTCTINAAPTAWNSSLTWRITGATPSDVSMLKDEISDLSLNCLSPPVVGELTDFLLIIAGQLEGGVTPATVASYPSGYSNGRAVLPNTSSGMAGIAAAEKTCAAGNETPGPIVLGQGAWGTSISVIVSAPA